MPQGPDLDGEIAPGSHAGDVTLRKSEHLNYALMALQIIILLFMVENVWSTRRTVVHMHLNHHHGNSDHEHGRTGTGPEEAASHVPEVD